MKINKNIFFLLYLLFFGCTKSLFSAATTQEEHELILNQKEKYLLQCMYETLNPNNALTETQKIYKQSRKGFLPSIDTMIEDMQDSAFKKLLSTKGLTIDLKKDLYDQIKSFFRKKIDEMNAQVDDIEGIDQIDEEAKMTDFDAIFKKNPDGSEGPGKLICTILEAITTKKTDLKAKIKDQTKHKYSPSLVSFFTYQLSALQSSKDLKLIKKQLNQILDSPKDRRKKNLIGNTRTIDTIFDDLQSFFTEDLYTKILDLQSQFDKDIAPIEASFDLIEQETSAVSINALLAEYKKMYKEPFLSPIIKKVIKDIIIMLESNQRCSKEQLAELKWYLCDGIPQLKKWKEPWYAPATAALPAMLITGCLAYYGYTKYKKKHVEYLLELQDKVSFLPIEKTEKDALLQEIDNSFAIQYIPVSILYGIDSVATFFSLKTDRLAACDKKINRLFEIELDAKASQNFGK